MIPRKANVVITQIKTKIDEFNKTIEKTEDEFANDLIIGNVFHRMITRYEKYLTSLRAALEELKEAEELSVKMIEKVLKTLRKMPQLYKNGSFDQKTSLLGLLLHEKLVISKNGY